jgi:hypothetical protein
MFNSLPGPLRAVALAGVALAALLAGPAQGGGPFQSGLRWTAGASLQTPWIPSSVAFGSSDNLVWVSGSGNDSLLCYDSPGSGVATPAESFENFAPGFELLSVAVGQSARHLYALGQRQAPDIFQRVTEVSRRDLLQSAAGAPFTAMWTHDLGFAANGPARMATSESGLTVVAAAWNGQTGSVRIDRLDGESGSLLVRSDIAATGLDEMVLSADGERTALLLGLRLVVLAADGTLLHDQAMGEIPASLALDNTGARIVVGGFGAVRIMAEGPGGYTETASVLGASNEIAGQVGISPGAETWAVAWWRITDRDNLRHEIYAGPRHSLVLSATQLGQPGGLQNYPSVIALNHDGSRVAFAAWGKGDSDAEAILYDTASATQVLAIDLPGSVMAMDLDSSGTRLALATKNLHANQFGSTGEVRMYDTGERDLTFVTSPRLGSTWTSASRTPGAQVALFLVGTRSPLPQPLPGALGSLSLVRGPSLHVYARPANLLGEAQLSLQIPNASALIGAEYALQVANRVAGQIVFSETTLDLLLH